MKMFRCATALLSLIVLPVSWAVYAPIPEREQGRQFTASIRAGVSRDNNIFGSSAGAISSTVFSVSPTLKYNSSLTDQTFLSASYQLTLDNVQDRPGDKTLDSHDLRVRLAHAFSAASNLDLSNSYLIAKNPESLLAGVPVNTDQSHKRNQFDARWVASVGQKTGLTPKFRSTHYDYDSATLGTALDRTENLFGFEVSHSVLPEVKLLGEVRRQNVDYRRGGANKDKRSDFLIGGVEYALARKLTASARLGYEWRDRAGATDTDAPYVELSGKYAYAQNSFLTGGYVHTLEEASDVALFTDTKVNRFFVNVQHAISPLIVASGSLTYEPSTLQGRGMIPDVDERTTRFGLALTYLPTTHWTISATLDNDRVRSDLAPRRMSRQRYGVNAAFAF